MTYRVRARNTATASANKIHDDTVARSLGFRGGLVPGVDVFAYLCHPPVEAWDRPWLERGTIAARFASPVYDGDEVEITQSHTDDGGLDLVLRDSGGVTCATAVAALPVEPPPTPDPAAYPSGPVSDDPPPASPESLEGATFGSVDATFRAERAGEYLADVGEDLAIFRQEQLAHPGWLLRYANRVLAANVALGPWIHVTSSMQLLGTVTDGDVVETRAIVTGVSEGGGHRFVDLDVLQVVGDRPVARTAHSAIYQPRGT